MNSFITLYCCLFSPTLTSVREPLVPLIVTLLWLKHLVTICCHRHTCDIFLHQNILQWQKIRKWSMCSQLKKNKSWKNLVVNCCPDIDCLPRHIPASKEHHVDDSASDDESDDESVDDSDDEKVTNLSSLTLQVTGPVVRQVIPSLCSISQWNGCWNIFNRCYPSSQCSGQRHN